MLDIIDSCLEEEFDNKVLRCVKIGLLCVQEHAFDRPTMFVMVFMLGNDDSTLPSLPHLNDISKSSIDIMGEEKGRESLGCISFFFSIFCSLNYLLSFMIRPLIFNKNTKSFFNYNMQIQYKFLKVWFVLLVFF